MDVGFVQTVIGGGVASILFQVSKGEWGKWPTMIIAVLLAASVGYNQGGLEGAIVAALTALSTHSVALNNRFGDAIKLALAPRLLRLVAEIANAVAAGIEQKPPVPPG